MFRRKKLEPTFPKVSLKTFEESVNKNSNFFSGLVKHHNVFADDRISHNFLSYLSEAELKNIVLDPGFNSQSGNEAFKVTPDILSEKIDIKTTRKERLKEAIAELEYERSSLARKTIGDLNSKPAEFPDQLNNVVVSDNLFENEFLDKLKSVGIKCVLILSDTSYTRNLKIYKKVIEKLIQLKIQFIEYTNLQPKIDRKLIFKISNFANTFETNAIIVVGSFSTSDISKIVFPKIIKPNLIRIHKHSYKYNPESNYFLFYFPTVVVPDPRINSRSTLKNNLLLKNLDFFSDSIFLLNTIENADCVFYYPPMLEELSPQKQIEILHETFFRLILNFLSKNTLNNLPLNIINNLKTIDWYLTYLYSGQKLNGYDRKKICEIIAATVDGRSFLPDLKDWTWYKLEAALSELVNSKKSDGLALFLPSYLEIASQKNTSLRNKAIELGKRLYGTYSVEGLVYKLLLHIQKYNLPLKFIDISAIKKVDYKFLSFIIKKAAVSPFSLSLTKSIIKNLTVW